MRKMKDSGIEWIGEIPEGWKVGQIGQLYSERRTKVSDKDYPPLSVTMKGILPQLSTAAKTDAHDDRKLVCKGDFAINSRSDRRGSCGISEQDGSISLINTVLQPRGEMNPEYYNWLFHTSMFADEFYKWGHGIVDDLWTTGWSDMKKIGVPVPSKCEQKQLAEHLNFECSNIDTMLSKTRSSIEEYKKLKQAVITQAVTKGVRGEREMKDSGVDWIGEIPKEWVIQKIKSISSRINVGVVIRPSEYFDENGTVPFLRGINVKEYLISSDNMVYINESSNRILSKSQVHTDDILIVRDRSIGTSCVVPAEFDGANVVSMVIATPLISCDSRFICYSLNSDVGKTQFTLTKIGSALTHTSVSAVSDIIVAVPSCAEQKEIADYLDAKCAEIDGLIAKKEQLVKELESYKKSLIYEVVTGKREV
jgi:type I restriction enzyme S subunit